MPGLASADPHTLPTLRISRMNGGLRSNALTSPAGNMELVHSSEQSRVDQRHTSIHRKEFPPHFDVRAAEESLSLYCKPVELYNIVQRRAQRNPFFLQRCLSYKIQAAHHRRIKLTISIAKVSVTYSEIVSSIGKPNGRCSVAGLDSREQAFQSVLVMLTSPISMPGTGHSGFRLSQTRVLRVSSANSSLAEDIGQPTVTFLLPEVRKLLLNAKRDGAVIIFITSGDLNPVCNGKGMQIESSVNNNGPVLWGSVSLTALCQNWLNPCGNGRIFNGTNGERSERTLYLDLSPSRLQLENLSDGRCVSFQSTSNLSSGKSMARLQLCITGEEVGKSVDKVRCATRGLFSSGSVSNCPSLPQAQRLQVGQVVFHYYYYFNQLYKSEVTDNFSCPFCILCCSSFKGLRCHLNSTHDLFSFEFLATPDYRLVDVSCRNDLLGPEGNVQDVDGLNDPRLKTFVYWSRSGRPRKLCGVVAASAGPVLFAGQPPGIDKRASGVDQCLSQVRVSSGHVTTCLPPSNSPVSQELKLPKDESAPHSVVQDKVHQVENEDQANITMCTSAPSTSAIAEPLELQSKSGSLQEQSRKHERLEEQEQACKAGEQFVQAAKKQRSEGVIVDEAKAQTLMVQSLASIGTNGVCLAIAAPTLVEECRVQSTVKPQARPVVSRVEKNRKTLFERSEARIRLQLQKRLFFHSHTAQPMALEQLISDRDSEDEVDDEITDLEDRRMLDEFVDVTQDEKELMHLWNAFVRRQRVLADGHCPWACEAFTKLHAEKFSKHPALRRCLMLFLTKLWNHHLVDGNTINRCLSVVDLLEEKSR